MTEPAAASIAQLRAGERGELHELENLSGLHRACLPDSLLSGLGHRAVVRYYAYVAASPNELAWVARVGGLTLGGCVLSYAPETLLRRFAARHPIAVLRGLARALATSRDLRRRCSLRLRERGEPDELHIPEIVQIFTDERHRGQGIGSQLLRSCEQTLCRLGVNAYIIRTRRDQNHAGIRFYVREGFAAIGEATSFGEHFVVMKKELG